MPSYFNAEQYKKYIVKQQGGKQYLMVIGALKAAIDYGVLLGSETTITETDDMVRVHVRIKVLNKHIATSDEDFNALPEAAKIGYYDGVADNPKKGGKGAAQNFPLEDAETSALGRALSKIGFNFETMATADEMRLVEKKTDSGYSQPIGDRLRDALKTHNVTTIRQANAKAQERFKKNVDELTPQQISDWTAELTATPASPVPPTAF